MHVTILKLHITKQLCQQLHMLKLQQAQLHQQLRMLDYSLLVRERWHSTLSSSDSSDCCESSDCNSDVDAS